MPEVPPPPPPPPPASPRTDFEAGIARLLAPIGSTIIHDMIDAVRAALCLSESDVEYILKYYIGLVQSGER